MVHGAFLLDDLERSTRRDSLLEQALKNQVGATREKLRKHACSTFLIVDAQSVKNTDKATLKGQGLLTIRERNLQGFGK